MQAYKIKPSVLKLGERLLLEKNVMSARLENLADRIRTLECDCDVADTAVNLTQGKSADTSGEKTPEIADTATATAEKTGISGISEVGGGENVSETAKLKREYRTLACELRSLERGLSLLDGESRAVLDAFYVNRAPGAADRLCELLNLERSHVYRLKVRALEKFCGAMPFSPSGDDGAETDDGEKSAVAHRET